ncbi:hypothetical protein BASA60_009638 [Batrachochytrium salamandrivorans]|nr:hypothetical protein BASA60_009638 [Batrachochytrium salamandrivorans]
MSRSATATSLIIKASSDPELDSTVSAIKNNENIGEAMSEPDTWSGSRASLSSRATKPSLPHLRILNCTDGINLDGHPQLSNIAPSLYTRTLPLEPSPDTPSIVEYSDVRRGQRLPKHPVVITTKNGLAHIDSPTSGPLSHLDLAPADKENHLFKPPPSPPLPPPPLHSKQHVHNGSHNNVPNNESTSQAASPLKNRLRKHKHKSVSKKHIHKHTPGLKTSEDHDATHIQRESEHRNNVVLAGSSSANETHDRFDTLNNEKTKGSRPVGRGQYKEPSTTHYVTSLYESAVNLPHSSISLPTAVKTDMDSPHARSLQSNQLDPLTRDPWGDSKIHHNEMKRTKRLRKKPTSPIRSSIPDLFSHVHRQSHDFHGCIMTVHISQTDALVSETNLRHPLVQVHIVDEHTGQYILKSDPARAVTTFNEPVSLDYLLPVITKPFELFQNNTKTPKWNEDIILNETYLHLVRPGRLILFEVLDMLSDFKNTKRCGTDGWHRVAWAFLKLVGAHGQSNTEQKMRLQLFKYPWWLRQGRTINRIPFIYNIFCRKDRRKYQSTLYVKVSAHGRVDTQVVVRRPLGPTEKETGRLTYEQLIRAYNTKKRPGETMLRSLMNLHTETTWRRKKDQQCKIPNKIKFRINGGEMGAFACSFSQNGMMLAVACSNRQTYPIRIYDVLTGERMASLDGHQDLVYQLLWISDDNELVSASADGSVRVWRVFSDGSVREVALYQHPTFVYTASICPLTQSKDLDADIKRPQLLATGAYDGVIRFWKHDPETLSPPSAFTSSRTLAQRSQTHKPIHKLVGHTCNINSIAFDVQGHRLFSADAQGELKIWSSRSLLISQTASLELSAPVPQIDYDCIKSIQVGSGPIHALIMHPGGRNMIIQSKTAIHTLDVRIFRFLTYIKIPDCAMGGGVGSQGKEGPSFLSHARRCPAPIMTSSPHLFGAAAAADATLAEQNDRISAAAHCAGIVGPLSPAHRSHSDPGSLFTRACLSPCGSWILCGAPIGGRVYVWRVETGVLVASYDAPRMRDGDERIRRDRDGSSSNSESSSSDGSDGEIDSKKARQHKIRQHQPTVPMRMAQRSIPGVVHIAFHPKDHYVCFVRWGDSQPVRVWSWDETCAEIGLGKCETTVNEQVALGRTAAALGYLDVDAIVNKSMASRLNLAGSVDDTHSPSRGNWKGQHGPATRLKHGRDLRPQPVQTPDHGREVGID